MRNENDDDDHLDLFKWEGPLDARKIVERFIAAALAGATMGAVFFGLEYCIG